MEERRAPAREHFLVPGHFVHSTIRRGSRFGSRVFRRDHHGRRTQRSPRIPSLITHSPRSTGQEKKRSRATVLVGWCHVARSSVSSGGWRALFVVQSNTSHMAMDDYCNRLTTRLNSGAASPPSREVSTPGQGSRMGDEASQPLRFTSNLRPPNQTLTGHCESRSCELDDSQPSATACSRSPSRRWYSRSPNRARLDVPLGSRLRERTQALVDRSSMSLRLAPVSMLTTNDLVRLHESHLNGDS